jgi:pyruvate/2-oxoglutarate/acetoin dehydrogenase E1 component
VSETENPVVVAVVAVAAEVAEVMTTAVAVAVAAEEVADPAGARLVTQVLLVKFLTCEATRVKASPLTEVYWG